MKKTKIVTCLFVCGLFLGACSNGNEKTETSKTAEKEGVELGVVGEFPVVKEPLKMTMMGPGVGMAEWKEMPVFQTMAEKSKIEFSFTTPPMADFATKLNLAFASGDLPDVLFGTDANSLTPAMEMDYGEQGILVPIEDLIEENMPHFSQILKDDPSIDKSITTPDGHIYSLPMISRGATAIWPRGPLWYNGEWLEKLGVTELPKTTDALFDLLVRFRDEDPNGNGKKDEIPLTDLKMESLRPWMMPAFGLTDRTIEEIDGTVVYAPATENYKAFITYMNQLYTEKLLDQEVYSQANEQKKAKGQNDQLGLFPAWYSFFVTGKEQQEATTDPMFYPLTSDTQKERIAPGSPRMSRATFAITSKNPSPAATLRWVDYFYSPEGSDFLSKGPEGVLWQYEENNQGEQVRVYVEGIDLGNTEEFRATVTPNYGLTVPTMDFPDKVDQFPLILDEANTEKDTSFEDFIASETEEKVTQFAKVTFPLLYLTTEESDKVRNIETDLQTYVDQMEAKFITGVEPIENWDKYIKTVESMGLEEYVAIYQGAYDRWASIK